jgi:hypothetical protein
MIQNALFERGVKREKPLKAWFSFWQVKPQYLVNLPFFSGLKTLSCHLRGNMLWLCFRSRSARNGND